MEKTKNVKSLNPGSTGIRKKQRHRLNLKTGILPSLALMLAASLFNIDFSWINTGKKNQLNGTVIRNTEAYNVGGYNPRKQVLSNIRVKVYSDINANQKLDENDLFLDQTISNERGDFFLELPTSNILSIKAQTSQSLSSWDADKALLLYFPKQKLPKIKSLKKAWLELKAKGNHSEFASSQIVGLGKDQKRVIWNHKPWSDQNTYRSPDLSKMISTYFHQGKGLEELNLKLLYTETSKSRTVEEEIVLKLEFENTENTYLAVYEKNYLNNGEPIWETIKLENRDHLDLKLQYVGKPPQCLSLSKSGNLIESNRFNLKSRLLSSERTKALTSNPILIPDPLSNSWLSLEKDQLRIWNTISKTYKERKLVWPFCLDIETCDLAYAYHPLKDEILLLDQDFKLWGLSIQRKLGDIEIDAPLLLADWKKVKKAFPGTPIRMAIDPEKEEAYIITQKESGTYDLNKIQLDGSKFRPLGPLHMEGKDISQVTGFEFRPDGELWLHVAEKGFEAQKIFQIDPDFQLLTQVAKIPTQEEVLACACMARAPYQISIQVFDDKNLNERKEKHERIIPNVKIMGGPYKGQNSDFRLLQLDEKQNFVYRTFQEGLSEFMLDESSLPEGYSIYNQATLIIPNLVQERNYPAFEDHFAISHVSSNPYIRWAGIRGELDKGGVQLEWATSKEINARTFQVLRSEDGIHFEEIGGVEPTGTSNEMQEYQYKDYLIDDLETPILAYRIKMKGKDGETSYSPVTKILITEPSEGLDLNVRVHPSKQSVKLSYQVLKPGPSEIRILNLTGNVMKAFPVNLSRNGAEKQVEIKGWAKGMYYAQLRNGEYSVMKRWILK